MSWSLVNIYHKNYLIIRPGLISSLTFLAADTKLVLCLCYAQRRNLRDNLGGGGLFIYSCYARRISFEINSNSKEIRRVEHEYMNKHTPPPISLLVTSLVHPYVPGASYYACAMLMSMLMMHTSLYFLVLSFGLPCVDAYVASENQA